MEIKSINDEVVSIQQPVAVLGQSDIQSLVQRAKKNARHRMRICAHSADSSLHQEMFIVHTRDVYVRPHRHMKKAESFLILEGQVDVVFFNETGDIADVMPMSDYAAGGLFYYRIAEPVYHTLIIRSDYLIFKESTTGPFVRSETTFAPWSPDENDHAAVADFQLQLRKKIAAFSK